MHIYLGSRVWCLKANEKSLLAMTALWGTFSAWREWGVSRGRASPRRTSTAQATWTLEPSSRASPSLFLQLPNLMLVDPKCWKKSKGHSSCGHNCDATGHGYSQSHTHTLQVMFRHSRSSFCADQGLMVVDHFKGGSSPPISRQMWQAGESASELQ